jgi:nicotinamidase-related amidase
MYSNVNERKYILTTTDAGKIYFMLPDSAIKVTKGVRFDKDQNSAFDETGLTQELRKQGIRRLLVGGLAEDVCVV